MSPHHELSQLDDLLASPGPTKPLRRTSGPACQLFVLYTIPLRTPTPISPTLSTLSPSSSLSLLSLLGRRSYKRKVHPNGLIKQLLPMSAFDGVLSIRHCRIFDQHVALCDNVKVSPLYTGLPVFPSSLATSARCRHTFTYPVLRSKFICKFLISPNSPNIS